MSALTLSTYVQPNPWVFVKQQAAKYASQKNNSECVVEKNTPLEPQKLQDKRFTIVDEIHQASKISRVYLEAIKEDSKNQSFGLQRQITRQSFYGYSRKLPFSPYEL
ncbi:MAG TPA: hypothetical protein VLG49_03915 [Rhabdochlamydiaceae bacterium]|nr:hypothetical protein [Rhabdochlamydiaceae bacterium]